MTSCGGSGDGNSFNFGLSGTCTEEAAWNPEEVSLHDPSQ